MTTSQMVLIAMGASVGATIASLALVAVILVRLPKDYFHAPRRRVESVGVFRRVGRNLLGLTLTVVGIILSLPFVPGSGILAILLGVMMMDLPGKCRLERALLRRPIVFNAINRIRRRYGKEPVDLP